jgi:hypothetical protein
LLYVDRMVGSEIVCRPLVLTDEQKKYGNLK